MNKIVYPPKGSVEYNLLIDEYKSIFCTDITSMQNDWNSWKIANGVNTISETVEELLVADTAQLADVYERFIKCNIPVNIPGTRKRNPLFEQLDEIFKYNQKFDKDIATFFIEHADALKISTCYYCEMAYINTYTLQNPRHSPNRVVMHRQFDVDHFLPKQLCPILGLSFFNFVPSCQVCNSRIKGKKVLGKHSTDWDRFNPASEKYSFCKDVKIRLRMRPGTLYPKLNTSYIHFRCRNGYRDVVDFFHLEERYDFHRQEALRLRELKAKYPKSTIARISKLLGKPQKDIQEDIFHTKFITDNGRCFAKLTRDILEVI